MGFSPSSCEECEAAENDKMKNVCDTKSLEYNLRDEDSNPGPLSPQAKNSYHSTTAAPHKQQRCKIFTSENNNRNP